MSSANETQLIVADSEQDANMLYAVGMFVPDSFIYLNIAGRPLILVSDLEFDRARRDARHCRVLPLSRYAQRLRRKGITNAGFARIIQLVLKERRIRKVVVPANFPHGLARQLRDLRLKVKVKQGAFFPDRERKNADEVKKISAALMMAEVGLAEAIQMLRHAKIGRDRKLVHHGVPLTSEKLQAVINIAIIQVGGLASHTIVSGGRQACDPHERGRGVLRAHEPIIIDIFPRSQKTGYFGDITRTVVKGRASESVRRLYQTVLGGQEVAFKHLTHGAKAAEVHAKVQEFFKANGYKTRRRNGRMEGFFHGTGHGLGLALHEAPRLGASSEDVLATGNVVTVEPGLYYPRVGAVRLEDVALITQNGVRNLTKFEKLLEV